MNIKIQENIPLSRYTTFKIGGPARFFCEVKNAGELIEAVQYAKENNLAAFVMGGGSNIVVSDNGFDGLVIKISSVSGSGHPAIKMRMENGNYFIECWTGENLGSLIKLASDSSLTGLEWAAGIPGTVGGAVRGNAGAFGGCMADVIESVSFIDLEDSSIIKNQKSNSKNINDKSKVKILSGRKCDFSYRNSVFKQKENLVIVSVVLTLIKGDKKEIESKIRNIAAKRTDRYPRLPSAGSFFQNPVVNNPELVTRFERDINDKCKDNKVAAGWLISEVGLQGRKIGQIQISDEHNNFLINLGGGTAADVVMLASLIKQKVRDELGVQLIEEVKYVGF